jgi:hypothetical protein
VLAAHTQAGSEPLLASGDSRFLLATVRSVSKHPFTLDAATIAIGNKYLTRQMVGTESRIEVVAEPCPTPIIPVVISGGPEVE